MRRRVPMELWLAVGCAVLALPGLFMLAWGVAGGDGEASNVVDGLLGLLVGLAALASVGAALGAATGGSSTWAVAVTASPVVLAVAAIVASGPQSWRGAPASRLTAEDVAAMGLDPAEHGFDGRSHRLRNALVVAVAVGAPIAAPLLVWASSAT